MNRSSPARIMLDQITLVAVTSINLEATLQALEACQRGAEFGACKLLTHQVPHRAVPGVEIIIIPELATARDYSHFILHGLADYVAAPHCLVVQWDGYVLHPERWRPEFLDYDYIGASWPQFDDGHDVGNGGFSLRSRRLLKACQDADFIPSHPEDVAIGRINRAWLERQGMRFGSRALADSFSAERAGLADKAFGFHGVWHMPSLLGAEGFWSLYQQLEDRTSVYHDLRLIMGQIALHPNGLRRCCQMVWHKLRDSLTTRKNPT